MLQWSRKRLATYWESLTPNQRANARSIDYLNSVLLAARYFDREGVLPFHADFDDVQAGDLTVHMSTKVMAGYSPNTLKTYFGRFRKRHNPPEIGEERAEILLTQLRTDIREPTARPLPRIAPSRAPSAAMRPPSPIF